MGGRWPRTEPISAVRRVDISIGGDPWAELIASRAAAPAPVIRVSPLTLRALYAPSEDETAEWPALPEGVVTELGSGR